VTCDVAALGQGPEPSDLHAVYEEAVVGVGVFPGEGGRGVRSVSEPAPVAGSRRLAAL